MDNLLTAIAVDQGKLGQTQATNDAIRQADAINAVAVEKIALSSQARQLELYQKLQTQAMSCTGKVVQSVPLDVRFLQAAENPFIQMDITNTGATDETVIIGSVLGLAGAAPFYKQSASAADAATVADQNGANIRFTQGFCALVNHSPVVLNNVQMISSDVSQRAQPFRYFDLAYDNTVNGVVNNTTATFTRYDTDPNVVKLAGVWAIGPQTGLSVVSKAGKDMTLIFAIAGMSSVRSFKSSNG